MTSALWNIIFFALAIGLLVTIHEGGHYLAARWCKVKVYRFSIGFGPVIYRKTSKGGTEFALSLIPLGGYVKMKGEKEDDDSNKSLNNYKEQKVLETDFAHVFANNNQSDLNDSFAQKTVGQRALIIAAGPIFNIILAVVLYTIINIMGVNNILPVVSGVKSDSIAAISQLKDNDLITKVDGEKINNWSDFIPKVITSVGDKLEVTVVENIGQGKERNVVLDLSNLQIDPKQDVLDSIGFMPLLGRYPDELSFVVPESAADKAGIKAGDKIVAINGIQTPKWLDVVNAIELNGSKTMKIEYQRAGSIFQVEVTPTLKYNEVTKKESHSIGIGIMVEKIDEIHSVIYYSPVDALIKACHDTTRMSVMILEAAKKMISGAISTKNIAGPIALAKGAGESANIGISTFLWFLATLSINLGVINLLPIPVLDGGQLIYLAYEKVSGRRPNERIQMILTAVGITILISLTMLAIFNDLASL